MRMTRMSFALLALVAAAGACSDDDEDNDNNGPNGTASVRVVHASADAPNIDILLEDSLVTEDLAFAEASDYADLVSGSRNIKVRATGGTDNILNRDVTLRADSSHTVLLANDADDIETIVLTDDRETPGPGNIKLRIVHAAPAAGDVDVYITAPDADISGIEPTLNDLEFRDDSGYLEVPAGSYQVRVTIANEKTVILDGGTVTLESGDIRTAVALEADGGGEPFQAILLSDEMATLSP
jgi:hypothetical protein